MYYTQHKAIKLHLQPFHVEGAADRRGISADSVERRGWQDWGGDTDEATTKWFRLTITFVPPEDSRARRCINASEEPKQS